MPVGFPHRPRRRLGVRAAVLFGGARLADAEHAPAAADAAAHPARRPRLGLAAGRGRRPCRRARRWRSRPALPFAVGYFLALGAAGGAGLAYLAYLSRPQPAGPDAREWYPAGRLMAAMSLYGGALPVLVLPLIGGSYEVLRAPHGRVLPPPVDACARARLAAARPTRRSRRSPSSSSPRCRARWRPIGSASSRSTSISPGASRAPPAGSGATGRTCRRSPIRRASRCSLALALAASFAPGAIGVAGTSFSGALLFAYLIAGLALMHFIARGRAPWILWLVYAGPDPVRTLRRGRADASPDCSSRSSSSGAASAPSPPRQPEPESSSNGATACRSFFWSASAASARWATWSTSRTATRATSCCRRRRRCAPREDNLKRFEKDRAQLEARNLELKKEAEAVAAKLDGKTFLAIRQAGDTGQLYGSVTPRDIAELVTAGGFSVDRRQIVLDRPIKTLGLQPTRVALHPEVIVQVIAQHRPLRGRGRAPGARRGRDGGEGGGRAARDLQSRRRCSRRRRWRRQRGEEEQPEVPDKADVAQRALSQLAIGGCETIRPPIAFCACR